MASSKPAIVLVHGSYHSPAPYAAFLERLKKQGFETHCPQLPTADRKCLVADPNNPSFDQPAASGGHPQQTADAEMVETLLKTLVEDQSKEVLLVCHSSGGWTACEAAKQRFQREQRKEEGKTGGVIGVFFMAAFVPAPGESIGAVFAQIPPQELSQWVSILMERQLTTVNDPLHFFFHDLPAAEGEKWAKELTACPFMASPLTNDALSSLPSAYLLCEGDRVLTPTFQRMMIKATEERSGKKLEIYKCEGGHESFLSYPDVCVESIVRFAEKCA